MVGVVVLVGVVVSVELVDVEVDVEVVASVAAVSVGLTLIAGGHDQRPRGAVRQRSRQHSRHTARTSIVHDNESARHGRIIAARPRACNRRTARRARSWSCA
jgi:hypothetical protein